MKVYGGTLHLPNHPYSTLQGQVRAVVMAYSRAEVVRLLDAAGFPNQRSYVKDFWGVTGNPEEVAVASRHPGTILVTSLDNRTLYTALPLRKDNP